MKNQKNSTILNKLASRIKPQANWKDLSSLSCVEAAKLHNIVDRVRRTIPRDRKVAHGKRCSGTIALFSGPTGTGKTMAAEVLASELKVDLYRVDLSLVISKYIGETEKNLKRVFAAAEKCKAILFFDEADVLFGKRSEVKDSHDHYANIDAEHLLKRMEDYAEMVILATNMKQNIDEAFTRRIHFSVKF